MTITVLPSRNEFTAGAGQTVFNYTFKIFTNTDLDVYITPAGLPADDSTDLTTAYVVDPNTIGDEDGGVITLNVGTSINDLVTIVSNVPESRTTDYQVNGDFIPETVNNDFDRTVQLVKQVEGTAGRTLTFPRSLQGASALILPLPQAGLFMKWRGDLRGMENVALIPSDNIPADAVIFIFDTIAAMVVADLVINTWVQTKGKLSPGDGGSEEYLIQLGPSPDPTNSPDLTNGNFALLQATGLNIRLFDNAFSYDIGNVAIGSDSRSYTSETNLNVGNDPTTDDGTNWIIPRDIARLATGTNTYTGVNFPATPLDGQLFSVEFENDNTGASTLDGIDVKLAGGVVDPLPGDILGGFITDLAFHTSPADHYEITNIKVTGLAHWPTVANSLGGDPLNDIDFSIGRIPDSLGTTIITSPAITKAIDGSWIAGAGPGLFSGSVAIDTTYHLFEIFNPTTGVSDAGFSVFVNASDRPTGFSIYRRIASLYTDGSSNLLQFTQSGNDFYLNTPVIHYTDTSPGNSAVSVPSAVPDDIEVTVQITVKIQELNDTATIITPLSGVDIVPSDTGLSNVRTTNTVGISIIVMTVKTNTLGQYRSRTSFAGTFTTYLQFTMRWTDDRTQ